MKKPISATFATAAIAMASLGSASAVVIATDDFNTYSTGALGPSNGGSAGAGWSGAWSGATSPGTAIVTTTSLAPTTSGNRVVVSGASTGSALPLRFLTNYLNTATVYLGFVFRNETTSIRSTGLSLSSDASDKAFIGISSFYETRRLGILGGTNSALSSTTVANGTTYRLVVKLQFDVSSGNEVLNLFINQATEGVADATATYDFFGLSGNNNQGINRVGLFAGGTMGDQAFTTSSFDSIKFATTYAEAMTVPEPSFAMLIGSFGAIALLRRRRV
jgi:hypothetical protein